MPLEMPRPVDWQRRLSRVGLSRACRVNRVFACAQEERAAGLNRSSFPEAGPCPPRYRTLLVALVAALAAGTISLAGLEGPIGDAISPRHVHVYGTADEPSPEERLRTQVATRAGTWAGATARVA